MAAKTRKRRGRHEGSVFQREDGLWGASVSVMDISGKKRRITKWRKTKQEALAVLEELKRSKPAPADKATMAVYLEQWLAATENTRKATTHSRYKVCVRNQIAPLLGHLRLVDVEPWHVDQMSAQLAAKGASPRLQEMAFNVLSGALTRAVDWKRIPRNPCKDAKRPKSPKPQVVAMDAEEAGRFLAAAKDHRDFPLYQTALATGMRQGELLGLQWEDVDFQGSAIAVRRHLEEVNGKLMLRDGTKTVRSRRVEIDKPTLRALQELHLRQRRPSKGYVFRSPRTGQPIRKSNLLRRSFLPLLLAAGLAEQVKDARGRNKVQSRFTFHALRHTHATLLLKADVHPKVVQERLGHASISITLDTYSHVLPGIQREAADKLGALWESLSGRVL